MILRVLLSGFLVWFALASNAWADTYVMQARAIWPAASIKRSTCNGDYKQCFMTLSFAHKDVVRYVDIAAEFSGSVVRFEFMQDKQYLPVSNHGDTVLTLPLERSKIVTLFDPGTIEKPGLVQKPVIRQGSVITKIELLAFRQREND